MKTITAANAISDLFNIVKRVVKGHVQYRISCKEEEAVLLSSEDFESLIETLELLSSPEFLKRHRKARKEIAEGKTYTLREAFTTSRLNFFTDCMSL